MYIEFYLFNWTNPEDFNNPNKTIARPKLVELGPYVFRYVLAWTFQEYQFVRKFWDRLKLIIFLCNLGNTEKKW